MIYRVYLSRNWGKKQQWQKKFGLSVSYGPGKAPGLYGAIAASPIGPSSELLQVRDNSETSS